jgi:hypothetical protein
MYVNDHEPSHIHCIYGEKESVFDLKNMQFTDENLGSRAQKLVIEWANLYRYQLLEMWFTKQIKKLPPLE